jgi:hypothetical protein
MARHDQAAAASFQASAKSDAAALTKHVLAVIDQMERQLTV